MEPTIEVKPRPLRIISGTPAVIEATLNEIGSEYVPTTWNFAVVANDIRITVVLLSATEVRKAQIASANAAVNGGRR